MLQPAISIVLPTYNGSKYIRTSIESCLNQTFTDFELIIVNDCSIDNTASIIEEYAAKDGRIIIIHNAFNKKLPLSLNTVYDIAKIMVERQMNKLAQKLSQNQLALLYRKFAVFNAVQKNNAYKYKLYL